MARTPTSEREGDRARLFVALDLTGESRERLAGWIEASPLARADGLRLVPAPFLHATLVFLGWRDEGSIAAIEEVALAACAELAAPTVTARGVTAVPPRGPRLIALDLDDAGGRAEAVWRAVAGPLAAAELHEPERRPFWPHVTLARARRGRAAPSEGIAPPPGRLRFDRVTLYRSHLGREGARYEPLASRALTRVPDLSGDRPRGA